MYRLQLKLGLDKLGVIIYNDRFSNAILPNKVLTAFTRAKWTKILDRDRRREASQERVCRRQCWHKGLTRQDASHRHSAAPSVPCPFCRYYIDVVVYPDAYTFYIHRCGCQFLQISRREFQTMGRIVSFKLYLFPVWRLSVVCCPCL